MQLGALRASCRAVEHSSQPSLAPSRGRCDGQARALRPALRGDEAPAPRRIAGPPRKGETDCRARRSCGGRACGEDDACAPRCRARTIRPSSNHAAYLVRTDDRLASKSGRPVSTLPSPPSRGSGHSPISSSSPSCGSCPAASQPEAPRPAETDRGWMPHPAGCRVAVSVRPESGTAASGPEAGTLPGCLTCLVRQQASSARPSVQPPVVLQGLGWLAGWLDVSAVGGNGAVDPSSSASSGRWPARTPSAAAGEALHQHMRSVAETRGRRGDEAGYLDAAECG